MSLLIIRVEKLEFYLRKKNVFLLDLRGKKEFLRGHVDGAICISEEQVEEFVRMKGKQALYILYCEKGITSVRVGRNLDRLGYQVGTVAGGMSAYRNRIDSSK